MHSLIGNYREVAKDECLDLKEVDPDELARVRHICDEILTTFRTTASVKIRGVDTRLQTKLSVQGYNDYISMPDWCNKFHNSADVRFASITESWINPITGEINVFINKESANASRRAKQKNPTNIKTYATAISSAAINSNGIVPLFDDDDDDQNNTTKEHPHHTSTAKRRPYIPKK
jgi:hypothetical protein